MGSAIVPSYDGGTNVIGGHADDFPFSFGPGSFQRHLAKAPSAVVVTLPRLVLDLDTPRDLALARRGSAGHWLEDVLGPKSA
jgi:2-phospho-L-lactate guanylyltransferase (CobY/MobA/RfbA family)